MAFFMCERSFLVPDLMCKVHVIDIFAAYYIKIILIIVVKIKHSRVKDRLLYYLGQW